MGLAKLDSNGTTIYDNRIGSWMWNYWVCGKSLEAQQNWILVAWQFDESTNVLGVNLVYDSSKWYWPNSFIAKINPTTGEAK